MSERNESDLNPQILEESQKELSISDLFEGFYSPSIFIWLIYILLGAIGYYNDAVSDVLTKENFFVLSCLSVVVLSCVVFLLIPWFVRMEMKCGRFASFKALEHYIPRALDPMCFGSNLRCDQFTILNNTVNLSFSMIIFYVLCNTLAVTLMRCDFLMYLNLDSNSSQNCKTEYFQILNNNGLAILSFASFGMNMFSFPVIFSIAGSKIVFDIFLDWQNNLCSILFSVLIFVYSFYRYLYPAALAESQFICRIRDDFRLREMILKARHEAEVNGKVYQHTELQRSYFVKIVHELKTPLSSIIQSLAFIREDVDNVLSIASELDIVKFDTTMSSSSSLQQLQSPDALSFSGVKTLDTPSPRISGNGFRYWDSKKQLCSKIEGILALSDGIEASTRALTLLTDNLLEISRRQAEVKSQINQTSNNLKTNGSNNEHFTNNSANYNINSVVLNCSSSRCVTPQKFKETTHCTSSEFDDCSTNCEQQEHHAHNNSCLTESQKSELSKSNRLVNFKNSLPPLRQKNEKKNNNSSSNSLCSSRSILQKIKCSSGPCVKEANLYHFAGGENDDFHNNAFNADFTCSLAHATITSNLSSHSNNNNSNNNLSNLSGSSSPMVSFDSKPFPQNESKLLPFYKHHYYDKSSPFSFSLNGGQSECVRRILFHCECRDFWNLIRESISIAEPLLRVKKLNFSFDFATAPPLWNSFFLSSNNNLERENGEKNGFGDKKELLLFDWSPWKSAITFPSWEAGFDHAALRYRLGQKPTFDPRFLSLKTRRTISIAAHLNKNWGSPFLMHERDGGRCSCDLFSSSDEISESLQCSHCKSEGDCVDDADVLPTSESVPPPFADRPSTFSTTDRIIASDIPSEMNCWLDPTRIAQLFNNCISNSIKYTRIGGLHLSVVLSPLEPLLFVSQNAEQQQEKTEFGSSSEGENNKFKRNKKTNTTTTQTVNNGFSHFSTSASNSENSLNNSSLSMQNEDHIKDVDLCNGNSSSSNNINVSQNVPGIFVNSDTKTAPNSDNLSPITHLSSNSDRIELINFSSVNEGTTISSSFANPNSPSPSSVMNSCLIRLESSYSLGPRGCLDDFGNEITTAAPQSDQKGIFCKTSAKSKFKNDNSILNCSPNNYINEMWRVDIFLRDSGRGFSENAVHSLFKDFSQVLETDFHSGTGLGMSIMKTITSSINGGCSLLSEGEGKGAVAHFWMPLVRTIENKPVGALNKTSATAACSSDALNRLSLIKKNICQSPSISSNSPPPPLTRMFDSPVSPSQSPSNSKKLLYCSYKKIKKFDHFVSTPLGNVALPLLQQHQNLEMSEDLSSFNLIQGPNVPCTELFRIIQPSSCVTKIFSAGKVQANPSIYVTNNISEKENELMPEKGRSIMRDFDATSLIKPSVMILLIDDNKIILETLKKSFIRLGLPESQIFTAADGKTAVECIEFAISSCAALSENCSSGVIDESSNPIQIPTTDISTKNISTLKQKMDFCSGILVICDFHIDEETTALTIGTQRRLLELKNFDFLRKKSFLIHSVVSSGLDLDSLESELNGEVLVDENDHLALFNDFAQKPILYDKLKQIISTFATRLSQIENKR